MGILSLSTFSIPHVTYFFQRQLIAVTPSSTEHLSTDWLKFVVTLSRVVCELVRFPVTDDSRAILFSYYIIISITIRITVRFYVWATQDRDRKKKRLLTANQRTLRYCFRFGDFLRRKVLLLCFLCSYNMHHENILTTTQYSMRITVRVMLQIYSRSHQVQIYNRQKLKEHSNFHVVARASKELVEQDFVRLPISVHASITTLDLSLRLRLSNRI